MIKVIDLIKYYLFLRYKGFSEQLMYHKLGDYIEYIQPTKFLVKEVSQEGIIPILTPNKSFIIGATNDVENSYKAKNNPVIIFDDFTTDYKYVNFNFMMKSSATKILKSNKIDIKSFEYIFEKINYIPESHRRHWIEIFSNIEVQLPTHEELIKVTNLLSKIDILIKEKEKEIMCYEGIKKTLVRLLFNNTSSNSNLSDYVEYIKSGTDKREDTGNFVLYGSTGVIGVTKKPTYEHDQIIVARVGANTGNHYIAHGQHGATDNCLLIKPMDNCNIKYLFYLLDIYKLNNLQYGSGQPLITATMLKNLQAKIPNLKQQEFVSEVISRIDKLISGYKCELKSIQNIKIALLKFMLV